MSVSGYSKYCVHHFTCFLMCPYFISIIPFIYSLASPFKYVLNILNLSSWLEQVLSDYNFKSSNHVKNSASLLPENCGNLRSPWIDSYFIVKLLHNSLLDLFNFLWQSFKKSGSAGTSYFSSSSFGRRLGHLLQRQRHVVVAWSLYNLD